MTLIEIMVVLVIIGIVAALVVQNVIGRPDEARAAVARTDLRTIAASLDLYRLDNRDFPTSAQGLLALVQVLRTTPLPVNWATGGYLPNLPMDRWGHPYIHPSPSESGPYEMGTLGADGDPGGDGAAADIRQGRGIVLTDGGAAP